MRPLILALAVTGALAAGSGRAQAPDMLNRLHDALRLSAEQEIAWRDYKLAVTPSPDARARHQQAEAMMPRLTTPRRVALMDSMMAADLADVRRAGQGVLTFYDRLTPSQKLTFDKETARPPDEYGREP
jgi:hypothetical protein